MSVQKPRSQGKGDGRRDNLITFAENLRRIKKRDIKGKIAIQKNGRTIYYYGDKKPVLSID